MPTNTQKPEKRERALSALDVVDVWHTIQGEGPHAGRPAVFVRLAGCNLACPVCDTDYTSRRRKYTIPQLAGVVSMVRKQHTNLVVITGGEPLRQDIGPFVFELLESGLCVQIETNGTMPPADLPFGHYRLKLDYVCSPKTAFVHKALRPLIRAWKYVVAHDNILPDGLPGQVLGRFGPPVARPWGDVSPSGTIENPIENISEGVRGTCARVYIQPEDTGDPVRNQLNTEAAVQSCLDFGYTLCLQVHKYAGVR